MDERKKIWKRMESGTIDCDLLDYLDNLFSEYLSKGLKLRVFVGTDSQRKGKGYKFATVIVISTYEDLGSGVVVGRGSSVLSTSHFVDKYKKNKEGVKERMLYEVSNSIEAAYEISPLLDLYDIPLEVHADINSDVKWESSKALTECVGYILGMGYDFKVKPDAHIASKVADRASRM